MSQQAVFESEVLDYAFSNAAKNASIDVDPGLLQESLAVDCAVELARQFVEVLENDSFTSTLARVPDQPPPAPLTSYGLRLRNKYKDGKVSSMTFYRIKDSWQSTALSLVSLGIALATNSHTGVIVPSAGIVLSSWKQFVVLSTPANHLEIDTYEALIRAMARLATKTLSAKEPSVEDILAARDEDSELASIPDVIDGLKRLKELNLIEVTQWGEHPGDYSHPGNRWRPRI